VIDPRDRHRAAYLLHRVAHEPRRRVLSVVAVEELSPTMRRITLGGADLETDFPFLPLACADHVKVVFPDVAGGETAVPALGEGRLTRPDGTPLTSRDYSVRAFDPGGPSLTLDFVVHEHGPAGRWAGHAAVGSELGVLGPRGSQIHPGDVSRYLLVADETGLPAVERFLEELPEPVGLDVVALAVPAGTPRALAGRTPDSLTWIRGDDLASAATELVATVATLDVRADGFVFGAAEAGVMRALRRHLQARGVDQQRVAVRGYWRSGEAGNPSRDD
jgi:NADPH-dependent ferric siderophore reductase